MLNPLGISFTASVFGLMAVLAVLGLLAGAVFGWVSLLTLRRLQERVARLEHALRAPESTAQDGGTRPEPEVRAAAVPEPGILGLAGLGLLGIGLAGLGRKR